MLGFFSNNTRKDLYGGQLGSNSNCTNGNKKIKDYSYNPSDRIGKGFSSIVYKGVNQNTNEIVAIKAIDMKGVKDAISREMLDCQIEALRTIKHDNVLKCYDVVRESSHTYIITEFCNHGDLSGLVKKKRRLSEQETLKILRDIVSGFIQIGQKGFLHRDLKLANIFINDQKAKIADFGFAKKNKFSTQKQKYNVGSPLYMSPEALKRNIYSLKNDIWSIGIMAFEMLHGQTPWECKTQKQLIDKMTRIPVRFRDTLKISEPTKDFIKKCLEVEERDRMSLEDLKAWMNCKQSSLSQYPQCNILGVRQENLPPKLNLTHKPISNVQKLNYQPQTQLTQRLTSRSQRELNSNKENVGRPSGLGTQNGPSRPSGLGPIPKSIIERNNAIVVNQINTFRLIYKLMQKLKKNPLAETDILNLLANEVIKRVTSLKNCFDCGVNQYGLAMLESYMNERNNQGVKKYKSVVLEYFKKYTSQIKCQCVSGYSSVNAQVKRFLQKKVSVLKEDDDLLIAYWAIQFLSVTRETPKQKLDSIIDPKIKLNKAYIQQRIKELS